MPKERTVKNKNKETRKLTKTEATERDNKTNNNKNTKVNIILVLNKKTKKAKRTQWQRPIKPQSRVATYLLWLLTHTAKKVQLPFSRR